MDNQGQLDAKTLRYLRENTEVEHTLLTPFRWLIGAGKAIVYTLLLTGWFLFTLLGWTVNVGEYSVENRREAVCDPRAYILKCGEVDMFRFNEEHNVTDYTWDLVQGADAVSVKGGDTLRMTGDISPKSEEQRPTPTGWISFGGGDFFQRGDDVFRRKSAQMDYAIGMGALAADALRFYVAESKGVHKEVIRLRDAPVIELRHGKAPANAMSATHPITYGLCLKLECAADGSDLNYALFRGDVLWTKPALGKRQQHAVEALLAMDTETFWLREAHDHGIYNDDMTRKHFQKFQSLSNLLKAN